MSATTSGSLVITGSTNIFSPIVTDGLAFYSDSANPISYTSGSTRWNSLVPPPTNWLSLVGSPTFLNENGGIVNFNTTQSLGASQLFSPSIRNGNISGETPNIDFELTFEIVFRLKQSSTVGSGTILIFRTDATSFATPPQCLYRLTGTATDNLISGAGYTTVSNTNASVSTTNSYNINQWYHVVMSMRKTSSTTGEWFVMRNGVILAQQTLTDISWWQNFSSGLNNDGNKIEVSSALNHDRAIMRLYRKGLTQAQALQNFNATRDRFMI